MHASRTVELQYRVEIPEPKDRDDPVQVWLPLPASTPEQDVIGVQITASMPMMVHFDPTFGNAILHGVTPGDGAAHAVADGVFRRGRIGRRIMHGIVAATDDDDRVIGVLADGIDVDPRNDRGGPAFAHLGIGDVPKQLRTVLAGDVQDIVIEATAP